MRRRMRICLEYEVLGTRAKKNQSLLRFGVESSFRTKRAKASALSLSPFFLDHLDLDSPPPPKKKTKKSKQQKQQQGIITQPVRQAMSKIGFYLLLPAITFVKVAEAVDASILRDWWPLAANLCFSILLGAALGFAGSYAVRTPAHLRRTVVVASSIGNINTIPLLVVASLCQSDDLMFNEVLGNTCSTKGIAYVAVGMAVGSVFHHSIAFHMLKPPKGYHHDSLGTPGTRRSHAGGGGGGRASGRGASGGGGAMLGPPPPPPDATAIVVRPPAAALLPLECKHCGAPCLEEEDAETGGRRVSYAPTLATTGDGGGGFHGGSGGEFDGEDGEDGDDGDRRSSVSSWLSDDMFCGLETLSEAVHFLHTPHSTAKGLHHGLHWGNRGAGAGNNRPATPAPFARSASNAAMHAAAVRRSRHSAPETVGDEVKSPRMLPGGGGAGSRGASMPGDGSQSGAGAGGGKDGSNNINARGGNGGSRPAAASLESTLTTMGRAASSHVPGSLASAAAAAAAAGLHPSVFEHPNRQAAAAAAAAEAAPAAAPPPPPPRHPAVVMLSADAASLSSREEADAAAAAAAAAVAGDGAEPFVPFGGRLAAITTTQSHEPGNGNGGNGKEGNEKQPKGSSICRECSHDGDVEGGGGGKNNSNNVDNAQNSHRHLHQRRRSLSMTSGSSSSMGGDVPIGGGGGSRLGGKGSGGGGGGGAKDNSATTPRLHSSSSLSSSLFSRLRGALAAAWDFARPLRALLWFFFRPLFLTLAFIEKMLPVPAIISLAGIAVGCCPPLKRLLFGAHAPLEFVAHSLHTISGATVPVMSFILGAVLYRGPGKAKVPKRVLWGVILVRLVLVPVLGGLAVILAERAHWFRPVDPLFMFTLVRGGFCFSGRWRGGREREREKARERKKKPNKKNSKKLQKTENFKKLRKTQNFKTAPPRHRPDRHQHAGHRDDVPLQRGRDGRADLLAAPGLPRDAAAVHLRVSFKKLGFYYLFLLLRRRKKPEKEKKLTSKKRLEKKNPFHFFQMHVLDGQAADQLDGGRGPQQDRRRDQRPGADALKGGEKRRER